jgi:hypothetical protein
MAYTWHSKRKDMASTDIDLGEARIEHGDIDQLALSIERADWLFYQYHQTPHVKHSIVPTRNRKNDLDKILDGDYIRTIPIVRLSALKQFLQCMATLDPLTIEGCIVT